MKLSVLIARLTALNLVIESSTTTDPEISTVTNDSRKVKPGTLFAAVRGTESDGHSFIDTAVKAGAAAILYSHPRARISKNIPAIRITDGYRAYAALCAEIEGLPADKMTLCAVTGTNGKTTTAFLIRHLLSGCGGFRCGLLSTAIYDNGAKTIAAERTTPAADEVQAAFRAMADNGCTHAVMEQSSHGLDQYRTGESRFSVGVFTNLTGDHLDYHGTMERYFAAKRRLFTELLHRDGVSVINIDDPCGSGLADDLRLTGKQVIRFGTAESADWRISDIQLSLSGSDFFLTAPEGEFDIHTPYIGEHNIFNLCGALAAATSLGIPLERTAEYLKSVSLPYVPGRMERIPLACGAEGFVDYAHTDDALIHALQSLRAVTLGKIITVFGCGGNRDRSKRPRMGRAATVLSDITIITSDNPRSENPWDIIADIKTGISAPHCGTVYIEEDRAAAIELAVSLAGPGDALLIAGKGHEPYQEVRGVKHHFDDREILRQFS